jgi:hypothetical protein
MHRMFMHKTCTACFMHMHSMFMHMHSMFMHMGMHMHSTCTHETAYCSPPAQLRVCARRAEPSGQLDELTVEAGSERRLT